MALWFKLWFNEPGHETLAMLLEFADFLSHKYEQVVLATSCLRMAHFQVGPALLPFTTSNNYNVTLLSNLVKMHGQLAC